MLDAITNAQSGEKLLLILIALITILTAIATIYVFIFKKIRRQDKHDNELISQMIQMNEVTHYLNRRANAGTYALSNYDSRIMHELSNIKSQLNILCEQNSNDVKPAAENHEFNYEGLIRQIANMTNIDCLVGVLHSDIESEYVQVKNVLADVVHTTRNPLSGISAALLLLKQENQLEQSSIEIIADIEKYIQQITSCIDAYYKISQASLPLGQQDKIDFKNELSNRCRLVILSQGKKVNLQENISTGWVDQEQAKIIMLAVTCILENAISFIPDNGTISIKVEYREAEMHIYIQNNGPVVDEEVMKKIFERGFSTRNSSGRGLAIAKKAIEEKLNGIILCQNVGTEHGVQFSLVMEGIEFENCE